MLHHSPRSAPVTFLIALAIFALASCGGSSGGSTGTSEPDVTDNSGDNSPVDTQGGNPNASTSYFPVNSPDPLIDTLRWQYVFSNESITSTIDNGSVSINLGTLMVEQANTQPTERVVQYSAPVVIQIANTSATGTISTILSQDLTDIDGRTHTSTLDTNVLIAISATDEFDRLETEVDLAIDYPQPAEIFVDQSDLNERIGEVFTQQVSANVAGFISIKDGFLDADIRQLPSNSATVTETYTVTRTLPSLTVQGTIYNDVVEVDYSYNQLNPQTGSLEPTTTTYFLARGIGMIKATNISQLYGTPLDWELLSTNLTP